MSLSCPRSCWSTCVCEPYIIPGWQAADRADLCMPVHLHMQADGLLGPATVCLSHMQGGSRTCILGHLQGCVPGTAATQAAAAAGDAADALNKPLHWLERAASRDQAADHSQPFCAAAQLHR